MQRDHRLRPTLSSLATVLIAGLCFACLPGAAHAQTGPVVEVLDGGEHAQAPDRYDARGRRQAQPLTVRGQQQQPNTTIIVVPNPQLTPPMTTPAPEPIRRRTARRSGGYLAFGAQSGFFMGMGGGLALALAGERERGGATLGAVAAPLLGSVLAGLLYRWAQNDHWRELPGQVMSGIYPGAIQGSLLAGSIIHAFGLEDRSMNRTLGLAIGATTLLSMVLHGNAGEAAPKRAGLYYATLAVTAIALLPFAHAFDQPEVMLYGATAAGAVHLILTGMAPAIRW
ncbi:MAG: hypothetical protein JJ863_02520 [Deltaproteobacteria bacterium]|nr:hypothetical protein [Deltaproteobacteria bacterium]